MNADIDTMPFKDKVFKVVYSFGVLEHFDPPDIVRFLIEQRRTASYVLVDVPNDRCEKQCYGDERFYSDGEWKEFFDSAGLRVERTFRRGMDTGKFVGNCSVFLAADKNDPADLTERTDVYDYY